jgi:hypothetical protein
VIYFNDEWNFVGKFSGNRSQYSKGRSNRITAAFESKLNDIFRVEVLRIRRKARARAVFDALVNRQNRKITGAAQAPGVVERLHRTQNRRAAV